MWVRRGWVARLGSRLDLNVQPGKPSLSAEGNLAGPYCSRRDMCVGACV